jgi:hypothetical protein
MKVMILKILSQLLEALNKFSKNVSSFVAGNTDTARAVPVTISPAPLSECYFVSMDYMKSAIE